LLWENKDSNRVIYRKARKKEIEKENMQRKEPAIVRASERKRGAGEQEIEKIGT